MGFKSWLYDSFLPGWAVSDLREKNAKLRKKNEDLKKLVDRQNAYIAGLEEGMRTIRRIKIQAGDSE